MSVSTRPDARCFALVPCAGSGARAGSALAKQYVALAGLPMVAHTLRALAAVERLALVLVAVAPSDHAFESLVELPSPERFRVARCGGATRAETVVAGLAELARLGARPEDWVLVHDAARCLVRAERVDALIDACAGDDVGGLLALPVADTLKRAAAGRSARTLPRADVWQAQTPQMFRLGALAEALAAAGPEATDEASAIEATGRAPLLVAGASDNLKITVGADFAVAEAILRGRQG